MVIRARTRVRTGQAAPGIPPVPAVTWNPSDTSALYSFSNSNLTVTHLTDGGGVDRQCRATLSRSDTLGKFMFEQHLDDRWSEIGAAIGTASTPLDSALYGGATDCVVCLGNGYFGHGNVSLGSPPAFATGDVMGFVWDAAVNNFLVYKSGVFALQSGNGVTLSGPCFPMHTSFGTNDKATANFGATAFAFPITGTTSWDGTQTH